jgi:hypothetical protein
MEVEVKCGVGVDGGQGHALPPLASWAPWWVRTSSSGKHEPCIQGDCALSRTEEAPKRGRA